MAIDETRLLRSMRAVRRFAVRPIPRPALSDILEVARWTGSSKNTQPWHLVVVGEPETMGRLSRLGRYADHLAGAPLGIALVMSESGSGLDEGRLAQNVMLAAWAHGIGSCIASLQDQPAAMSLLGVPAGYSLRTVIALGYPFDEGALRIAPNLRSVVKPGRRPLEDVVSWGRYGRRRPGDG
jgi:nitroreductase